MQYGRGLVHAAIPCQALPDPEHAWGCVVDAHDTEPGWHIVQPPSTHPPEQAPPLPSQMPETQVSGCKPEQRVAPLMQPASPAPPQDDDPLDELDLPDDEASEPDEEEIAPEEPPAPDEEEDPLVPDEEDPPDDPELGCPPLAEDDDSPPAASWLPTSASGVASPSPITKSPSICAQPADRHAKMGIAIRGFKSSLSLSTSPGRILHRYRRLDSTTPQDNWREPEADTRTPWCIERRSLVTCRTETHPGT